MNKIYWDKQKSSECSGFSRNQIWLKRSLYKTTFTERLHWFSAHMTCMVNSISNISSHHILGSALRGLSSRSICSGHVLSKVRLISPVDNVLVCMCGSVSSRWSLCKPSPPHSPLLILSPDRLMPDQQWLQAGGTPISTNNPHGPGISLHKSLLYLFVKTTNLLFAEQYCRRRRQIHHC